MKRLVKIIVFFAFTWILYGMASEFFVEYQATDVTSLLKNEINSQSFENSSLPVLPAAELGGMGVHLTHAGDSRVQRVNFNTYCTALRDITKNIANRQGLLTRQWQKLCQTSLSGDKSSCEYYVFALRHIII